MNLTIFPQDIISNMNQNQIILGPHRVLPGRLSVSRSFGDIEAKHPKFGGMPNVITAVPDIISFRIDDSIDFIILGCDGIFDQLSDKDIANCVWMTMKESNRAKNLHLQCSMAVDMVIKTSLTRKTLDNVTCVLIAFENMEKMFNKSEMEIMEKTNSDKNKVIYTSNIHNSSGSGGNHHDQMLNTNYKFSYNNDYLNNKGDGLPMMSNIYDRNKK
jgi:serine/threonine protein phosphatase PrpC